MNLQYAHINSIYRLLLRKTSVKFNLELLVNFSSMKTEKKKNLREKL